MRQGVYLVVLLAMSATGFFWLEFAMSESSKKRRKEHRAQGRLVKEGKVDEAGAAAWKAAEEKRVAKLPKAK